MKRTMKKLLGVILVCMAMVMSICACGDSSKDAEKQKITVTFMNGETQLGQVTGTAGEKLSDYSKYEELDGYEFLGWYETPTLLESSKKDLE